MTCLLGSVPVNRFILNRTGWVHVGAATLLVLVSLISPARVPAQPTLSRWVGVSFLLLLCFPAMLITLYSLRLFISMNRDGTFKRWQGAWLLALYLLYLILQYGLNIGRAEG